jgi:hypothetical protein
MYEEKINTKILLSSMETLPNSDDCSESRINISVLASIHAVGRF